MTVDARGLWLRVLLVLVTGGVAGCTVPDTGEEPEQTTPEPVEAEEVAQTEEAVALHIFLPDQHRTGRRPDLFEHDPHVGLDCAQCHERPRGHGSHLPLTCLECHRPSPEAMAQQLAPADCQSCHHDTEQGKDCVECHAVPGQVVSEQLWALAVWDEPRPRELNFEHALHAASACAGCHVQEPALTPEPCSTCHEDHHRVDADCVTCHLPAPEEVHDVGVHQTCSGAGCHNEPVIEALSQARTVCLVCHQEQMDHESGGECIDCHRVRAGFLDE